MAAKAVELIKDAEARAQSIINEAQKDAKLSIQKFKEEEDAYLARLHAEAHAEATSILNYAEQEADKLKSKALSSAQAELENIEKNAKSKQNSVIEQIIDKLF